jgi:hypothetical protein
MKSSDYQIGQSVTDANGIVFIKFAVGDPIVPGVPDAAEIWKDQAGNDFTPSLAFNEGKEISFNPIA